MDKSSVLAFCTAASILVTAAPAHACGDKLSVIGGGVSFDRVSQNQYHGNIVMLLEPNSSLRAANDELKLRRALEFAGNKVRTVENSAELASVLGQGHTDVVLVSWGEAAKVREQLAGSTSTPTVLPVAYRTDPAELTSASDKGICYAFAKDKQLVRTVGRVMEERQKDQPVDCSPVRTASAN